MASNRLCGCKDRSATLMLHMQYAGFLTTRLICIIHHIYPNYLQQSILNKIINVACAFFFCFIRTKTNMQLLCCDYIKKYSWPIGFLYFYRPINIILSADCSDYIKDITRQFPKSVPKFYNRPIIGRHIGR